jgi:hypothetical protein
VVIATALLVLGVLVGDGLTLIYVSIGLTAAAGVVLFILRVSNPAPALAPARAASGERPATDDERADPGQGDDEPIEFPIADYDELTEEEILAVLALLYDDEIDVVADRERSTQNRVSILLALDEMRGAAPEDDVGAEEGNRLPIVDYDELSESAIVSVLDDLDEVELEEVKAHEQAGRARTTIIANIERRIARIAR